MPPQAALAFILAATALNPVVIVATAVAFPGQPRVVAARFAASFLTAVVVGLGWTRFGRAVWSQAPDAAGAGADPGELSCDPTAGSSAAEPPKYHRLALFGGTARHDFGHAGGFLVLGAATAATVQVAVPRSVLDSMGGSGVSAVLTLGLLTLSWQCARGRTRS